MPEKCPMCNGSGYVNPPADWEMELRYLSRQRTPIWSGPLQRGVDMLATDPSLRYLVEHGYVKQLGDKGFVITDKGRKLIANAER